MATGVTAVAQLDNMRRTFIAEAQLVQEHKGVMERLVSTKRLPKREGTTYNMPYLGAITASSLTDGVLFDAPQQITDTSVPFTPAEVGVQVLWTRRLNLVITEDFPRLAADLMMNAIEYKRDTDLIGQLDSFGGIAGAAGTAVYHGLIAAGVTAVREGRTANVTSGTVTARTGARTTGDPPVGQKISVVFHERNRYDLSVQYGGLANVAAGSGSMAAASAQISVSPAGGTSYEQQWRETHMTEFSINGARCYVDGNFTIDGSDDIKGGIFAQQAIQHITFQGVQDYQERTSDGRAVLHTIWVDYGYGEYNDAWGRELYIDATSPAG